MTQIALVVDDEQGWRRLLAEILTDAGWEVHTAGTLADALDLLHAHAYHLAVVDLSLDHSDHSEHGGLKVLAAIAEMAPACRAILVTGYATVELAVRVIREGRAAHLLEKSNFSRVSFMEVVTDTLAQTAPTTPPLTPPTAAPEGSRSALIVEDDAGWRSILTELLTDAGYTPRPCNSFGEAVGLLKREAVHVAVVDLSLAGEDQAGLRLLEHTADIPTIVVSGVASTADIEDIYADYDVFAHLEKQSFDRAAFLRTLEALHADTLKSTGIDELTPRERDTLKLLMDGLTNKEIAEALTISPNTVKRHLKAIFAKLDVTTRTAAAAKAMEAGL